jgi:hypothetical protein
MANIQNIHTVLEILITKAALTGKTLGSTIRIPYKDLSELIGKSENKDIDLVLTFSLEWDESSLTKTTLEDEYE